jgi:DNA-binding transcriptional MerR regulator
MDKNLQDFKGYEFQLEDLVDTAAEWIGRAATPPADGRVSPLPDARTVRYYQTVGIMQKPLRYDGRNAIYGYHHLLQLIAIKLLQRQGLSLAQIQNALLQATSTDLEKSFSGIFTSIGDGIPLNHDRGTFTKDPSRLSIGKIEEELPCSELDRTGSFKFPIYRRPEKKGGRKLIAVEIATGISIVIDPEIVQDPEEVLDKISRLLNAQNGEIE